MAILTFSLCHPVVVLKEEWCVLVVAIPSELITPTECTIGPTELTEATITAAVETTGQLPETIAVAVVPIGGDPF
ncbi:MAG: hypothetical protein JSS07_06215 [Proteobacteria bacterium]|nr:hypothetical protein [Pseudomonadota bacterium]